MLMLWVLVELGLLWLATEAWDIPVWLLDELI